MFLFPKMGLFNVFFKAMSYLKLFEISSIAKFLDENATSYESFEFPFLMDNYEFNPV